LDSFCRDLGARKIQKNRCKREWLFRHLKLLKIGSDDTYDVIGGLFRRLRIARHMVSDVVFHQFAHEAIDGAARGGQTLQHFGALLIFIEAAENALELANDFLAACDEVEFFARGM
jgi:hypothetical protein